MNTTPVKEYVARIVDAIETFYAGHISREELDTLFSTLFDFVVNANGVANHEVGVLILVGLFLSDFLYGIHKSLSYLDLV